MATWNGLKITPLFTAVCVLNAFLSHCEGLPAVDTTTLRFVQMISHHGKTSPETLFKNDSNNALWTMGPGQLLEAGRQDSFELGRWFRQRYFGPDDNSLRDRDVYIRSTDTDRTMVTAHMFAAGIHSQQTERAPTSSLDNVRHPFPVHVIPKNTDPFTDVYVLDHCKRMEQFMDILRMTPEEKRVYNQNKDLGEIVFRETGKRLENSREFLSACDILNVEKANGLQYPNWIKQDAEHMFRLRDYFSFKYIKTPEITQLSGGHLIREIMHRMLDVMTNNTNSLKAYVYIAHDYTIMYIMATMRLFNYILPPYSSALLLELHENNQGDYFVQVLYKNETQREPYVLSFPLCPEMCPWQQALLTTGCYFVENLSGACTLMNPDEVLRKQQELDQWLP